MGVQLVTKVQGTQKKNYTNKYTIMIKQRPIVVTTTQAPTPSLEPDVSSTSWRVMKSSSQRIGQKKSIGEQKKNHPPWIKKVNVIIH